MAHSKGRMAMELPTDEAKGCAAIVANMRGYGYGG